MVPDTIGTFPTETWLTSDVIDAEVDIPGYSVFHSDQNWRTHGDVAFYLNLILVVLWPTHSLIVL